MGRGRSDSGSRCWQTMGEVGQYVGTLGVGSGRGDREDKVGLTG